MKRFIKLLIDTISKIVCKLRSNYYTTKIDNDNGRITFTKPFIRLKIIKQKGSKFIVVGDLRLIPHAGGNSIIYISLGENSNFEIKGDFTIGQGVRICLGNDARLIFGGKEVESSSGITSDTLIMVNKSIEIGKDFLCAWNIFISDSDWHQIDSQKHQSDILIGNHVWIANSCNILKGSIIGSNSIVASNTKIINSTFPDNVLIGGIPPKILKTDVRWSRDI